MNRNAPGPAVSPVLDCDIRFLQALHQQHMDGGYRFVDLRTGTQLPSPVETNDQLTEEKARAAVQQAQLDEQQALLDEQQVQLDEQQAQLGEQQVQLGETASSTEREGIRNPGPGCCHGAVPLRCLRGRRPDVDGGNGPVYLSRSGRGAGMDGRSHRRTVPGPGASALQSVGNKRVAAWRPLRCDAARPVHHPPAG